MTTQLIPKDLTVTAVDLFGSDDLDAAENIVRQIEESARSIVPDTGTVKGRRAIASTAAHVARSKTYLDGLGKDYAQDLKARVKQIDQARRGIRDRLDALKVEVRKPLDDWQQAEEQRVAEIEQRVADLRALGDMAEMPYASSAAIAGRIKDAEAIVIDPADWAEFEEQANQARLAAIGSLYQLLGKAKAEEEAERQRIEAERIAKEQREREIAEQAAAEAKAKAERQARMEADRVKKEAEERAAEAQRKLAEAEENARRELEARARAEREKTEAEARRKAEAEQAKAALETARIAAEVAAEKAERDRVEAEKRRLQDQAEAAERTRLAEERAERERIEAERIAREDERLRIEEDARKAEEERAARERDEAHRAKVLEDVIRELTNQTDIRFDSYDITLIVNVIAEGSIPHVSITF